MTSGLGVNLSTHTFYTTAANGDQDSSYAQAREHLRVQTFL